MEEPKMGKSLNGKSLGKGISQERSGLYVAGHTTFYGKRVRKRFKTLSEAKQWLIEAEYEDLHSNPDIPTEYLVDAWYEEWFKSKSLRVKPGTLSTYSTCYRCHIKPAIGKLRVVDVTTNHCIRIVETMAKEGRGSATIDNTKRVLHDLLECAMDRGIIQKNPCNKSVRSDIGTPPKKREALTREEQSRLLSCMKGKKYENIFRFILLTALRIGELIGLRWQDIDFDRKMLKVERTMEYRDGSWEIGPPKSDAGYRSIPLSDEAIRILQEERAKQKAMKTVQIEWRDQVFLSNKGKPISDGTYQAALHRICAEANVRQITPHTLRHTFATRCIENGMKPKTLQKILGHKTLAITMNLYVHVTEDEISKEYNMVSESLCV